jgi:hypothetical protein
MESPSGPAENLSDDDTPCLYDRSMAYLHYCQGSSQWASAMSNLANLVRFSHGPLAYKGTNILLTAIQKVSKLDRAAAAVRAHRRLPEHLGLPHHLRRESRCEGRAGLRLRAEGPPFRAAGCVDASGPIQTDDPVAGL